ncbi:alpha/beta hydrolase [Angustibacter luteus]|uniref:Prolyl oligopeptidase family serine peptidase n=1 Tax=Angustibacter luteus TaxID=658456 RepID=A0ABW1JD15_9ACTN
MSSRGVLDQPAPPPDAVLRYGPLPEHVIDVRWPAAATAAPLVVVVHGGYWREEYDRTHAGPQCVGLAAAGYAVAAIEYRRTGSGNGWDELSADVAAALEQVGGLVAGAAQQAGMDVDPARTVLVGHSAGGHLVAWAAATRDLPGVVGAVSLAGVLDLTLADDLRLDVGPGGPAVHVLLGGSRVDVPQRYAAADPTRLGPPAIPVVALHGDADDVAPLALSESYCAATGQRLVVLAGTDHFAWIDPQSTAWPHELAAIDALARSP